MAIRKNKLVCLCNGVTETAILRILKKGARDINDVRKFTLASSGCGKCKGEIEAIMEHYFRNKISDLQQNIDF